MNTDHIKTVFGEYLLNPHAQYAILINGPWGSGKTFFWENQLKPFAVEAGKDPLYISLNGISTRVALEQLLFIRMWKFLNRSESHRKTQFLQLLGNAASALARKKLDMNLPELLRGFALESGINDHYLLCFDDLERCQMPLAETLGFINDFVEHHRMKAVILSDESRVNQSQPDFAGIKEKIIGRTFNIGPDHTLILPHLMERHASQDSVLTFLQQYEPFILNMLISFKEDNLRIIDAFLSAVVRMYLVFSGRNEKTVQEALLCALTITIEHKRGRLTSQDVGDYKNLPILEMAAQQTSKPGQDTELLLPDFIKDYARDFFMRYLKGQAIRFHLWKSIYDFILSGYLDEAALQSSFDARDPDRVPDYIVCYTQLINYRFRHLEDIQFKAFTNKVCRYAEEGLYQIYDYLLIADFYFYFSDNGLITLSYQQILFFVKIGLGKAAKRGETNDEVYGNMMHFKKDNDETEKFKEVVSMVHLNIVRQRKHSIMQQIGGHIREGEIDEITRLFHEHRTDTDLLPASRMEDFCNVIRDAPNRSISQLAKIFGERYNVGLCQLLTDDAEPLGVLDRYLDTQLLIGTGGIRRFVLGELSQAVKEGISGVEYAKKHPLKSRKNSLAAASTEAEEK
jgi:hypothetical protein